MRIVGVLKAPLKRKSTKAQPNVVRRAYAATKRGVHMITSQKFSKSMGPD